MNIMRALIIVGAGLVATATAQAASQGSSVNEDHKLCKQFSCVAPLNPLTQR